MLGGLVQELIMNKLRTTICALVMVGLIAATTPQCAISRAISRTELLVMYARVAVIELCQEECTEVAGWIADSGYELFRHGRGSTRQHLVIFTHVEHAYLPYAILALDKDGLIEVVERGIHLGEKAEFIETFKRSGNSAR